MSEEHVTPEEFEDITGINPEEADPDTISVAAKEHEISLETDAGDSDEESRDLSDGFIGSTDEDEDDMGRHVDETSRIASENDVSPDEVVADQTESILEEKVGEVETAEDERDAKEGVDNVINGVYEGAGNFYEGVRENASKKASDISQANTPNTLYRRDDSGELVLDEDEHREVVHRVGNFEYDEEGFMNNLHTQGSSSSILSVGESTVEEFAGLVGKPGVDAGDANYELELTGAFERTDVATELERNIEQHDVQEYGEINDFSDLIGRTGALYSATDDTTDYAEANETVETNKRQDAKRNMEEVESDIHQTESHLNGLQNQLDQAEEPEEDLEERVEDKQDSLSDLSSRHSDLRNKKEKHKHAEDEYSHDLSLLNGSMSEMVESTAEAVDNFYEEQLRFGERLDAVSEEVNEVFGDEGILDYTFNRVQELGNEATKDSGMGQVEATAEDDLGPLYGALDNAKGRLGGPLAEDSEGLLDYMKSAADSMLSTQAEFEDNEEFYGQVRTEMESANYDNTLDQIESELGDITDTFFEVEDNEVVGYSDEVDTMEEAITAYEEQDEEGMANFNPEGGLDKVVASLS